VVDVSRTGLAIAPVLDYGAGLPAPNFIDLLEAEPRQRKLVDTSS
jgi:hypothetical protein